MNVFRCHTVGGWGGLYVAYICCRVQDNNANSGGDSSGSNLIAVVIMIVMVVLIIPMIMEIIKIIGIMIIAKATIVTALKII